LIAGYNAIMVHVVVFIFNSWIVCCVFVCVCVCVCVCLRISSHHWNRLWWWYNSSVLRWVGAMLTLFGE